MSDSVRPHRWQPTRLPDPWDSPSKDTGVGCHCLLCDESLEEIFSWRSLIMHLLVYWKDWCWSWSSNTLATWCREPAHQKRHWCWERLKAWGEGEVRGWDDWMASPTQWTWVWASSGGWWRTEAWPAAAHMVAKSWAWLSDWATEQQLILMIPDPQQFNSVHHSSLPVILCLLPWNFLVSFLLPNWSDHHVVLFIFSQFLQIHICRVPIFSSSQVVAPLNI